jgi:hypothetical protein
MKVYFVATIRNIYTESTRVVGYFKTLEEAKTCVETNSGDIYENGYYKYAVIEDLKPGLYPQCQNPIFYEWFGDNDTGSYKEVSKPKDFESFIGFTIG